MIADFRDRLAGFVAHEVRSLVVGAHALGAHGVPRVTGDPDLGVEPTAANARRVQLGLPRYRIDVMTSVSSVTFADAWESRLFGVLFEVAVAFIGRDAFIRNERASGRPKDLEDLRSSGE